MDGGPDSRLARRPIDRGRFPHARVLVQHCVRGALDPADHDCQGSATNRLSCGRTPRTSRGKSAPRGDRRVFPIASMRRAFSSDRHGAKPPFEERSARSRPTKWSRRRRPTKSIGQGADRHERHGRRRRYPRSEKAAPRRGTLCPRRRGLASLGAGGLLFYWGRKDNSLLTGCSPNCPQSSVDHVRKIYLASDRSAGRRRSLLSERA